MIIKTANTTTCNMIIVLLFILLIMNLINSVDTKGNGSHCSDVKYNFLNKHFLSKMDEIVLIRENQLEMLMGTISRISIIQQIMCI